jgi:hypothetical protein
VAFVKTGVVKARLVTEPVAVPPKAGLESVGVVRSKFVRLPEAVPLKLGAPIVGVVSEGDVRARPASEPVAVPLKFGAPIFGAVKDLFVKVSVPASVAKVPETPGRIRVVVADCAKVVLNAPVSVRLPLKLNPPAIGTKAVPPGFTAINRPPNPVRVGSLSKPAAMRSNSARIDADVAGEEGEGNEPWL